MSMGPFWCNFTTPGHFQAVHQSYILFSKATSMESLRVMSEPYQCHCVVVLEQDTFNLA